MGFVFLMFVAAWPGIIFYEFFGVREPSMVLMAIIGIILDVALLYLIGRWLDGRHATAQKSYAHKLPTWFSVACAVAIASIFIDPSCR